MRKRAISIICAVLLLSLTLSPASVFAADGIQPFASSYLSQYSAWATSNGGGEIQIDFDVSATSIADSVGASKIIIQIKIGSSWTNVYTFNGTTSNGMLGSNCLFHCNDVTYQGSVGSEYRAVVTVYAKIGSGSDTRTINTGSVIA
jgi:hypothetical protein